jgi:hypothetical protein
MTAYKFFKTIDGFEIASQTALNAFRPYFTPDVIETAEAICTGRWRKHPAALLAYEPIYSAALLKYDGLQTEEFLQRFYTDLIGPFREAGLLNE